MISYLFNFRMSSTFVFLRLRACGCVAVFFSTKMNVAAQCFSVFQVL